MLIHFIKNPFALLISSFQEKIPPDCIYNIYQIIYFYFNIKYLDDYEGLFSVINLGGVFMTRRNAYIVVKVTRKVGYVEANKKTGTRNVHGARTT